MAFVATRRSLLRPSNKQLYRRPFPVTIALRGGSSSSTTESPTTATEAVGTTKVAPPETEPKLKSAQELYNELLEKLETITHLGRAQSVLSYDQLVFMPSSAGADRGKQLSALAGVVHGLKTDPSLKELLDNVLEANHQTPELDTDALRVIHLERKAFEENERIPSHLAAKAAGLSASAYGEWVTARDQKDFGAFCPTLQECFQTATEMANAKRGNDSKSLYDQMLDEFEAGMGQERIDAIFGEVSSALVPLIAKVLESPDKPSEAPLGGGGRTFAIQKQQRLSEKLVKAIGYDSSRGRIDVSVHPFSSSMSTSDVRITSRFSEDEWYQGLAGTLHEGGHAMYEQNLLSSALGIDSALSMGAHESQSLFWERHIGLSKPFWKFAHTFLQSDLDESFQEYTPEEIYGAVNRVSNSLIRVEADELTYPLHVILRYNIEKDVVSGNLNVQDISKRWNDDMKSLLDVQVPSDDQGVLQDVHWSGLAFGYFPTYLLGAIAASQLYHYCQRDILDLDSKIETGDFGPIKDWLGEKIHKHGKRYDSLDDMLEDQLGEPLNPKYFIEYLTTKYSDLYNL